MNWKSTNVIIVLIGMMFVLNSCGSSGGGSKNSNGLKYSGKTSKATITKDNAKEIMSSFFTKQNGGMGSGFAVMGKALPHDEKRVQLSYLALYNSISTLLPNKGGTFLNKSLRKMETNIEVMEGNCPGKEGEAIIKEKYDEETGEFSATATFKDYCIDDLTISSGTMSMAGTMEEDETFEEWNITFSGINASIGACSSTMHGDMTIASDYLSSETTIIINMLTIDNVSKKVYKIEDLIMDMSGDYYMVVDLSGKYYDPDNGYVEITSPNKMQIYGDDISFSSGEIRATGANKASVSLQAIGGGQYKIKGDFNGDGFYEYTPSESLTLDDLTESGCSESGDK